MAGRRGRIFVAVVAVALVLSTPVSFVGVAGGTNVSAQDGSGEKAVYPGQTVEVVNVSVGSEDELITDQMDPSFGHSGEAFSSPITSVPEMYLDTGDENGRFDNEDIVIRFQKYSRINEDPTGDMIEQLPDKAKYFDTDGNQAYSSGKPIIIDNSEDGELTNSDQIMLGGSLPLVEFSDTKEANVYLDAKEDDFDGFGIYDPVFEGNNDNTVAVGPLDEGKTRLVRSGNAPIEGFDSIDGDSYFINDIDDLPTEEFDEGEALLIEDGDGKISEGELSRGDRLIRNGTANIQTFSREEVYFVDEVEPNADQYNPSEAIIEDVGEKEGRLDGGDKIIFEGENHVSAFTTQVSTFGTGDVYIGNSDGDEILDDTEFIYIESGDSSGYDIGEDLVVTSKGSVDLNNEEISTDKLSNDGFTNIGFLDLNGNGDFDAVPEGENNPGSEPIVFFEVPTSSISEKTINSDTDILGATEDQIDVLDIQGTLKEGEKYLDIADGQGPYENGDIVYLDSSNGEIGELDEGETLVEKTTQKDQLTIEDYVIHETDVDKLAAYPISNDIEYIDASENGAFDDGDYIIESSVPDDGVLNSYDEIVALGSSDLVYPIETGFEFVDSDDDGSYDVGETIISSNTAGDGKLDLSDSIYMSSIAPGQANIRKFETGFGENRYAEAYIDSGDIDSEFDSDDFVIGASLYNYKDSEIAIFGERVKRFDDEFTYIDSSETGHYSEEDVIFFERDNTKAIRTFGDRLTALTIQNHGTLPADAIESVTLHQNETEIASTTTLSDGVWTLETDTDDGIIPPGESATNLSVTATLAADAPTDETVDFAISAVDDGGSPGEFDTGDRGMFFADESPAGGIDAGPTYTVADPSDITADAIAFRDPDLDHAPAIELAFTDDVDPASTEPGDFAIETMDEVSANVTNVSDDDGDGRLLLEIESGVAPSAVESVVLADGGLTVGSGAVVPGQTLPVETTSVTIAEAQERPRVVYQDERVAVLANDGGSDSESVEPNHDESLRIDQDTTGDGTVDDLRRLGSTGNASLLTVLDTGESNASGYRVTFQSEDGDEGETVSFPVENLSLSASANRTNTTDVAGPIGATITASGGDRLVLAELLDATNGTVLESRTTTVNETGEGTVAFPARVANVTIAVTDLATGVANRTENVTVRKGYPGATFSREVYEDERGDIASIEVELVDTETTTVSVGSEAVNYHERITVVDRDGDGNATLELNTHLAGSEAAGTGIELAPNGNRSAPNDEVRAVRRSAPAGEGLADPLDPGSYTLEATVDGDLTDVAILAVVDRATTGASTRVAPAGVALDGPADVENWTTPRDTVAVGDTAVVAVEASGLEGYLNDGTDLRRGSPAAAETGAYVDVRRGNPPPNRPARRLNVSKASTIVDGEGDALFVVLPSDGDPYTIEEGEEYEATFVLNETSPYVPGDPSASGVERETAETAVTFESPDGRFADLDENRTLDLPASANATIAGETNVAPGTTVTITVRSDDDNVTFQETEEETVSDDGTFEGSVDLADYPEGTDYTVVATANDEDLTAVRTGTVVESPLELNAAQNLTTAVPQAGGGGGGGSDVERTDTATPTETVTESPTTADETGSMVRERAATFVTEEVPEFIRTQETNLVIGIGILAFVYALVGLRRLTR